MITEAPLGYLALNYNDCKGEGSQSCILRKLFLELI